MKRKLVTPFLSLFMLFNITGLVACASQPQAKELDYRLSPDESYYIVTGIGEVTNTDIIIPSTYNSLPVTSIIGEAFKSNTQLTSVTIPDSVTFIGAYAFNGCTKLTTVTIGNSVASIGEEAFRGCAKLTTVTIGSSIASIDNATFTDCSSLTSVYYKGTQSDWNNISIGSFNGNLMTATRYYYSESQPTDEGNYWRYVDGVPTFWA